jgi:hypothetical protein
MKIVEDVGAPLLVTAVDILTLETKPEWNEWASYIMTGIGYLGGAFLGRGFGPISSDFLTKVGIASLPLTARGVYAYVKSQGAVPARASQRLSLRSVSRAAGPVSRQYQTEFEGAGSHAF